MGKKQTTFSFSLMVVLGDMTSALAVCRDDGTRRPGVSWKVSSGMVLGSPSVSRIGISRTDGLSIIGNGKV